MSEIKLNRKQRRNIQFKRIHNFDEIIWQYLNSQEIKHLQKQKEIIK